MLPYDVRKCLCCRTRNRRSKRATLNVRAREEPILSSSPVITLAWQAQHTKMPVRTVTGSARRERSRRLDKRVVTSGVPKRDLVRREVDLVRNIVPLIRLELDLPLALAADHPLQVGVGSPGLAVDPAVLELREVALKEADLVLIGCAGDVGRAPLDREVVEDGALVDGCLGLRNELSAPHVLV
jgi:hypothetical protein